MSFLFAIQLQIFLLLLYAVASIGAGRKSESKIAKIGPVGFFPKILEADRAKQVDYTWSAEVDCTQRTAYSKEYSHIPSNTPVFRAIQSSPDGDLLSLAERLFCEYPVWLCRASTSLGLLQAVPEGRIDVGCGYKIQTRPFGINLISFGKPISRRLSFRIGSTGKEHDCMVVLPITGGILTRGSREDKDNRNKGSLRFTLKTIRSVAHHGNGTVFNQRCSIVTGVSGYRPALLPGGSPALTLIWTYLYLGAQSAVHANVMWRFHKHCRRFSGMK
jgi:hypothetical protein